jgi:hypothetical protein
MGYTTEFNGTFILNPPATQEQIEYINKFSGTRRMRRDVAKLQAVHKGEHGLNGNYGVDGEYFVGGAGHGGQDRDETIVEYNSPPSTQPGLWCQWILTEDGTQLQWDEGEKFYKYIEWLKYLITNFFEPWGNKLSGNVIYQGEEIVDRGVISVLNNEVEVTGSDSADEVANIRSAAKFLLSVLPEDDAVWEDSEQARQINEAKEKLRQLIDPS